MKKLRSIIIVSLLLTLPCMAFAADPPDPGNEPGAAPPLGGGAPVGSGVFILLGLGAAYGVGKIYKMKEEDLERDG